MKSYKKIVKKVALILTLLNLSALVYGIIIYPYWIVPALLVFIIELLIGISYLHYRAYLYIEKQIDFSQSRNDALFSIHQIIKLRHPLPIMQKWTIGADYGHALIQYILSSPAGNILDVGSGISTILAGYSVEKRGKGKVIALEHDLKHYNQIKRSISEHMLDAYVTVYYCPLVPHTINGKEWLWYDLSTVTESLSDVNLVSIDGPPGGMNKQARYPAMPLLQKRVATDAAYLLDDGSRKDEKLIAKRWESEFNIEASYVFTTKGMYLFRHKLNDI
jgi:hypothetical protein